MPVILREGTEITDKHGRKRRAREGEVLADGESCAAPLQYRDSSADLRHTPGGAPADRSASEAAYAEMIERMQGAWRDAAPNPAKSSLATLITQFAQAVAAGDVSAYAIHAAIGLALAKSGWQGHDAKPGAKSAVTPARSLRADFKPVDHKAVNVVAANRGSDQAYEAMCERMRNAWKAA
jgi:hypothetical protein